MVSLSDLLRLDQIQLNLQGADKASVLRELVEAVPELRDEPAQRDVFLQALLDREKLHTTAIGEGIALPHARNPLGGLLKKPLIVFGRHLSGVSFGALDNNPVHLLFLIASPDLTDHLAILARISRVLRDQKLRGELMGVMKNEEVIRLMKEAEQRLGK
jgi:mannitol/fructose-specific phosphotransferase system IIA component (Ntr-type)